MRQNGGSAVYDCARIQATFTYFVFPNGFTRLWLDRVDHAIAGALNQQSCITDSRDDRRRIGGVVRPATGCAYPNGLARSLIKSHEAMRASCVLPPTKRYATDNNQITVDYWRYRAAAVCRQQTKIFTE